MGGSANSCGLLLQGADNNIIQGAQFIVANKPSFAFSVKFRQWSGDPRFPMENVFINLGSNDAVGGQSGTLGNTFLIHQEGDGSPLPKLQHVNASSHSGEMAVAGKRSFRTRDAIRSEFSGFNAETTSNLYVPLSQLTATIVGAKKGGKIRATASLRCGKLSGGSGSFILSMNLANKNYTETTIPFNVEFQNATMSFLEDIPDDGDYAVGVYFKSSDTNKVISTNGALIVEELY